MEVNDIMTYIDRLLPFSAAADGGNKVLRNRDPFIPESLL